MSVLSDEKLLRERFEEWCERDFPVSFKAYQEGYGSHNCNSQIDLAWNAWRELAAAVRAEREAAEPVGFLIDWPDEPDLGHYFAEYRSDVGRNQPLYLHPPQASATVPDDVAKDAERYRWMRSNWTTMHSVATDTTLKLTLGDEPWAGFGPDVIDSAIDAAMLAAHEAKRASCLQAVKKSTRDGGRVEETLKNVHVCVPEGLLSADEMGWLRRFAETTEDEGSYDIPNNAVRRLCDIGALSWRGHHRYQITDFGDFVLSATHNQETPT